MKKGAAPTLRLHLAVGLLSVAVVALQLALMQLLAISQWHHFAYMVISVALLGFGAAGTLIALARQWLLARLDSLLPLLFFAGAAAIATVVRATGDLFGSFDSYLLFTQPAQILRLLLVDLAFALPFFLAALAIGLVFTHQVERIGTLYFANLFGSGLGGLVGIALLWLLPPAQLPAVTAFFALAGGLLLLPGGSRVSFLAAAAAGATLVVCLLYPAGLPLSQYKDLQRTLQLPQARLVAQRSSPQGLVQIVSGPALRHAPGLSLAYTGEVPASEAVFSNGNWFGPLPAADPAAAVAVLDHTTAALPYALRPIRSVLLLQAGTGGDIAQALAHGAQQVVAVESQGAVLDLLKTDYGQRLSYLFANPAVRFLSGEPRTALAGDRNRYDLVRLPTVGAFGGTAGLFALQEESLLTREAFADLWQHLTPEGLLCVSAWLDYPARNPLRLAATLVETLEAAGIAAPADHLAAVRSWGTITFCAKRSPLTAEEIERGKAFCERMLFDPSLLPGLAAGQVPYNHLEDRNFSANLKALLGPERPALYAAYPFRLAPASDNRPFFSQFLSWRSLPRLSAMLGERALPFVEMGTLILLLTLVQMTAAAVLLIILPLCKLGWRSGNRVWTLLYFGGLAVGYMLFEMVLIHRFVLYLGHPVYAAAAVIAILLTGSGAGSYLSQRLAARADHLRRACALVSASILFYALLLPPLLQHSMALPLSVKVLLTLLLLAPPAFAMGFPFPLGLRLLARRQAAAVPWAWGINGCLSVLSTALATLIAVEAGFTQVLLLAALAYALAALSPPTD